MKTHKLKIAPEPLHAVIKGLKPFEYRKNDRDFQVGDMVILAEWEKGAFTGFEVCQIITYILHGGQYGIPENYCMFSFEVRPPVLKPMVTRDYGVPYFFCPICKERVASDINLPNFCYNCNTPFEKGGGNDE